MKRIRKLHWLGQATMASVAVLGAACGGNLDQGASSGPADGEPGLNAAQSITSHPYKAVCDQAVAPGEARCNSVVRTDERGVVPFSSGPQGLAPVDLQDAYKIPVVGGNGSIVAIVDAYDSPTAESDLAAYRAHFGLPACTTANGCFHKVNQSGTSGPLPAPNTGWAGEIALDLDMASAACPDCKILLVEANSPMMSDLGAAENTAVQLGAAVVSNSYAGPEDASITIAEALYFNHPGVGIFASSGDDGYGVMFPASSRYVTAVGGTSLTKAAGPRGWTESAWAGAGSGCSQYIGKPSWQKDAGCTGRTVADVAAVANPNTGVSVYNTFGDPGWVVYGGTSVSSPLVAAIYALTGSSTGSGGLSYHQPAAFFDVTTGANGSCGGSYLCTAKAGYDGPTGNGTPNASALAQDHPQVSFTQGDFNGDGKLDQIVTTAGGSYWHFSNGDGTFGKPYTRNDLPLGSVSFVPGDFNGDGKTDLVITTASGSYWYFSKGDGTWTVPATRTDLPLGSVSFVPGDFNGDGKTDLIVTTAGGSYWHFSNGDGTFSKPYTRNDLPLGSVSFVPGDFSGDGKTDLVITTASGSYWYFSKGDGTWTVPYTRTDLPLGSVSFAPGDFNGDHKTDLVVTTAGGSYWHFSNGDGTFSKPYTRNDLPLGSVSFVPGDFNGDHKTDLVITTASGSYWYFSKGDGTWTVPYTRADLLLGTAAYAPGDYSGDGKTDLVITTRAASYWYFSKGDGTWTVPYTRTDLPL